MHLPALPVTAEVRHNLFLAFKEAVHNVVRHATATEARIVFTLEPEGCTLAVQDNGKGFDPSHPPSAGEARAAASSPARLSPGNGLSNMRKRLDEIGGQCSVESTVGQGTVVTFNLPLKAHRE